ncbi:MAG: hypothetical protein K6A92_05920 [Lachnospiraceae bacterium]|nr:hypothetical protein [Lachnospiraceae bacterium]
MKKTVILPLIGALMLSLTACGAKEPVAEEIVEETLQTTEAAEEETTATEEAVGLANPWREITEEEAMQYAPNMFSVPEGGENAIWSVMEAEETPLVQVMFDLDGNTFTAREQVTGDEYKDISGVYYEWDAEDTSTLAGWGTGLMEGKFYRHIGDEGYTDLATWFDVEIGISYSLSVTAADLDGFDIQAVVEAMYDPAKQASNLIPDDYVPMDITGCDTFTQIVDKLEDGAGYANVVVGGEDLLLISPMGVYDNGGYNASIDAEAYYYKDGVPTYVGHVSAGGTAYPLAVKDGLLYAGWGHGMITYTFANGMLIVDDEAYEVFDESGNATYYHTSNTHDVEAGSDGSVADDSALTALFDRYGDAEVIEFAKEVK